MASLPHEIYKEAVQHYQSGNLLKTEQLCRKILEDEENHLNAHNLLAAVCGQTGQLELAVTLLQRVIELNPGHVGAHNNLGITLHNLRRLDEAVSCYHQSIQLKPGIAETHYNLGLVFQDLGRLDDAEQSYRKAIQLKPEHIDAQCSLGNIHNELGRLDEAVSCYRQAILLNPGDARTHYNLGSTLNKLDQFDEAVASFKQAISLNPNYAEAHFNLGNIHKSQGRPGEAVDSYQQAIQSKPDYTAAHYNLGYTLNELDRMDEAVASYRQAIHLKPDYAEAFCNLGNSLNALDCLEEAAASYIKAIELEPAYAEAHSNLGVTLNELGRLDEAVSSYQQAIVLKPDYAEAYYHLSLARTNQPGESQIKAMEKLAQGPDIGEADRVFLNFALAKALDDIGEQERSFKYLNKGNSLRRKELNYSIDNDKKQFAAIKGIFSKEAFLTNVSPPRGPSPIRPVFILGMPRSGTSLIEQILASHSTVHGAGELGTIKKLVMPILSRHAGPGTEISAQDDIKMLREGYLDSLKAMEVPETIITDKMPHNFKWIGWMLAAFPEAKIIHLNRDPIATCFSIYKRRFPATGMGYGYDFQDLAAFYNLYLDLMSYWRNLFPNAIYDICYEDFTEHQEQETRKLLAFCDLQWEEQCLDFQNTQRVVKTASATQVQEKMYQGSSEAWRKYEAHLQPLIKALMK